MGSEEEAVTAMMISVLINDLATWPCMPLQGHHPKAILSSRQPASQRNANTKGSAISRRRFPGKVDKGSKLPTPPRHRGFGRRYPDLHYRQAEGHSGLFRHEVMPGPLPGEQEPAQHTRMHQARDEKTLTATARFYSLIRHAMIETL